MTLSRSIHVRSRRGFGTFVAILLLLLVAATLPVIASVFAADAKRTRTQAEDAQLRQLLTAGALFAKTQATADAGGGVGATTRAAGVDVPLPTELKDAGAKLSCELNRIDPDHLTAVIDAHLASRSMEQTVDFDRHSDGTWHATGAALNRD